MAVPTELLQCGLIHAQETQYRTGQELTQTTLIDETTDDTGPIKLNNARDIFNLAKNADECHVPSMHISVLDANKASLPNTVRPSAIRIPREGLATTTAIVACQDLGIALTRLQNATGAMRTPIWTGP
ncbi:uncharacterized protein N7458_008273 [Penicillium daleae]|uniref:Uncharacterized protein n=1 Tax=Penicillium daleae TaxID=63821 RepID=A0AAD6G1Z0_9EURO|nr:uncharacterized protein N7458_008273 [Penicillium daleae]KAJ5444401.1 hypothetical protein N7458_008273 [Penicillium daleae]